MFTFGDGEDRFRTMEKCDPLVSLTRIYDRDNNNTNNTIQQRKKVEVNWKMIMRYDFYVGQELDRNLINTLVNGGGGPHCFYIPRTSYNNADTIKKLIDSNLQMGFKFEDSDMEELIRKCMSSCNDETKRNSVLVVEFEVLLVHKILDRGDVARISKLVRAKFRGDEGRGSSCSICLDEFAEGVEVVHTPCAHLFHVPCLSTWFGKNEENGCPICRASI